jgi:hypothetical protein
MSTRLAAAALLIAAVAPVSSAQSPPPDPAVAQIKKDLFFLAGDECQGRGIETKGINRAGDYIAEAFKKAGLKPGGPGGSYFQPFKVLNGKPSLGTPNTMAAGGDGGLHELAYKDQFIPLNGTGKTSAGLAFVGYGITSARLKYDDYAGIDVAGKWVIVLRRTPRWGDKDKPFDKGGDGSIAALTNKLQNAHDHKAAGVILINDRTYAADGDPDTDYRTVVPPVPDFPVVQVKRAYAEDGLANAGLDLKAVEAAIDDDLKPRSRLLDGITVQAELTVNRPFLLCRNVIGVLDGSGPLANETVVIGAHYDHLGLGEPGSFGNKGKVHYGADDNASGTCGVLELARRFGAKKDGYSGRRIVFIAFSGEERGLLGSEHYCKNPTFPLKDTVLMLNMDMIGRASPGAFAGTTDAQDDPEAKKDRLVVYGTGTAAPLDKAVDRFNEATQFRLNKQPHGAGPSDHESFFLQKVPVLFFFTGLHQDYHRPTDTPDKINLGGIKRTADLVEMLAAEFASRTDRLKFEPTTGGWVDPITQPSRKAAAKDPRRTGPTLGLLIDYPASEAGGGVVLQGVTDDGAAKKGGIKAGDILLEVGGKPTKTVQEYMTAMAGQKPGVEIEVVVQRGEKKLTLKVTPLASKK